MSADDVLDVPVEQPVRPDADESLHPELVVPVVAAPAAVLAPSELPVALVPSKIESLVAASASAPSVPRPRAIYRGTRGLDVVAVKRALARSGYLEPPKDGLLAFTQTYGATVEKSVKEFQAKHGILASGAYGTLAHNALVHTKVGAGWAFDEWAIHLMREEVERLAGTVEDRMRRAMVATGFFLYENRDAIPYVQARPFPLIRPPFVPKAGIDCSAFYTLCSFVGGAPDPNGRDYDGQGYTGTLMDRGRRCSIAELKPGDAVFYGFTTWPSPAFPYGSPTHVAMFIGGGMVLSNGSHPIGNYPVGYRAVNHYRTYEVGL